MPSSNYPNGFPQGVTIKGVPLTITNPGRVFWVGNSTAIQTGDLGGSNGNPGTVQKPFATLTYAFTRCVANRGDVIIVKPGHAESITAAAGIAASIAGVAVIGLGSGSNRPTFTFTTANTAAIAVSADNISFTNCVFIANFLSIAAAFTLTTAKYFTLQSCWFTDTSGILNFLQCVKANGAANTADGLTIQDCTWFGTGTTSVGSMVLSADALNFAAMLRNRVVLERTADAAALLTMTTGACVNSEFTDNITVTKQTAVTNGGTLLNVGASSTGSVSRNYTGSLVTTGDKIFTTTVGLFPFENRVSGVVGATGFVIPAVDS